MSALTVYLETSVLSYLAARVSRDPTTRQHQLVTRRWWMNDRDKYKLMASEAVEAECGRGDPKMAYRRRALLKEVTVFPLHEKMRSIARLLVVPGAIPEKARVDATHIAAAAVEECDFLLTWSIMATAKRPSVHPKKSVGLPRPVEDEILRDVYAVRDAYAAEHGHDLDRIFADLKRRESKSRLVRKTSA